MEDSVDLKKKSSKKKKGGVKGKGASIKKKAEKEAEELAR